MKATYVGIDTELIARAGQIAARAGIDIEKLFEILPELQQLFEEFGPGAIDCGEMSLPG